MEVKTKIKRVHKDPRQSRSILSTISSCFFNIKYFIVPFEVQKMISWIYTILGDCGLIKTQNPEYAELKSKSGYIVFCKTVPNIIKFHQ